MANQTNALADELVAAGYAEYFLLMDHSAADAIWDQPDAAANLNRLVMDNSANPEARFLAAEILYHRAVNFPPESAKAALAEIYTIALAQDYIGVANPWGLPDSLEVVGRHLVELGEVAVPKLIPLLDDETVLLYEGSKEATLGNSYAYRVKDFAAYFISQIRGIDYPVHQTQAERDVEIDRLKMKLP